MIQKGKVAVAVGAVGRYLDGGLPSWLDQRINRFVERVGSRMGPRTRRVVAPLALTLAASARVAQDLILFRRPLRAAMMWTCIAVALAAVGACPILGAVAIIAVATAGAGAVKLIERREARLQHLASIAARERKVDREDIAVTGHSVESTGVGTPFLTTPKTLSQSVLRFDKRVSDLRSRDSAGLDL